MLVSEGRGRLFRRDGPARLGRCAHEGGGIAAAIDTLVIVISVRANRKVMRFTKIGETHTRE